MKSALLTKEDNARLSEGKEIYDVPEGYRYTKDHEWTKTKPDGNLLIGITDYAAKMLHDIVYVDLPKAGDKLEKKSVLGQVESVKTVSDIYSPVSCTVLKSNDRLTKEPEIVSSSPYEEGWMLEVQAPNYDSEVADLLNPDAYKNYILEIQNQAH
jgi:glycine cleavage system H protein